MCKQQTPSGNMQRSRKRLYRHHLLQLPTSYWQERRRSKPVVWLCTLRLFPIQPKGPRTTDWQSFLGPNWRKAHHHHDNNNFQPPPLIFLLQRFTTILVQLLTIIEKNCLNTINLVFICFDNNMQNKCLRHYQYQQPGGGLNNDN